VSVAITLKSIPDEMMDMFRAVAAENHRSVSGEIMYRLKKSLEEEGREDASVLREEARIVADEWDKIGGNWVSNSSIEEEMEALYSSRSMGRDTDLSW